MVLMREPRPLPSAMDYVPPNSKPLKVGGNDSWWSIADRPDVASSGMSAMDICFFNFRTRDGREINWYLHHKVGCRRATQDGKNYRFSAADTPGIIHVPIPGPKPPLTEVVPDTPSERLNAWIGIAGKAGTQFVVVGVETLAGYLFSLDDLGKQIAVGATINRAGLGFGASGGFAILFVTGVKGPGDLNGHQQAEPDFNVAIGGKWDKFVRSPAKLAKLKPLIELIKRLGSTPIGIKSVLKASPEKWLELIKTARTIKEYVGINPGDPPNVLVIDIPVGGGGAELSVFYGLSNYEALWDLTD